MEQARLNELLVDPNRIAHEDIAPLQALVDKHPYFRSARLLLLKGLHQEGSVYFDDAARTCAAHVPDRHVIYQLTVQKSLQEKVREVEAEMNAEIEGLVEEVPQDPSKQQDLEQLERLIVSEALESTFTLDDIASKEDVIEDVEAVPAERSFLEWITGEGEEPTPEPPSKTDIIDSFLTQAPIEEKKTPFFSATDMGKLSLVEDMSFVTETLAKIYEQQGHFEKAIKAYEHLGLKEPQKSTYFAARLKKLEEKRLKK